MAKTKPRLVCTFLLAVLKSLHNIAVVNLTVQIRLFPTMEQADALRRTLERANAAANRLSELAWQEKEFRQFPMHRLFYYKIRSEFDLVSQMVIRLNAKVADAYKIDRNTKREFRKHGSISYDCRIVRLMPAGSAANLWTVDGRETMPFACDERARRLLALPKGESDLILRKRKWFLNVSVDVPEQQESEALGWIGIDLGLAKIAQSSDGETFGDAGKVAGLRRRRWRQRKRLQKKATRSARRVLRRMRGREKGFMRHTNHTISKQIVAVAKRTGRGIALEDLTHILDRIKARKNQRQKLHSWAFADIQAKITYKSRFFGVPVRFVDPRNTSRTCPACASVDKRNRKTQALFACVYCGFTDDADTNAARNISRLASIDRPHESN